MQAYLAHYVMKATARKGLCMVSTWSAYILRCNCHSDHPMKNIKGNVIFESQRGLTCRVTITRSEMSERGLASLNFIHCMRLSQALYEEIIIHLNLTRRDLSPINGLRYNFTLLFLISLKVLAPKFTSFISSSYFLVFLDQFVQISTSCYPKWQAPSEKFW